MVFSHARADTSDNEPQLFMRDSVIALSELEMLYKPATNLVVLSACQTQVGKNASGEGIYSLSRGFAAAGIPAVAATLWQANDQSIYKISRFFSENLSKGMSKDEALTKAKLDFMKNSDKSKSLPFYWANLILIGNADPIVISDNRLPAGSMLILIIAIGLLILLLIAIFRRKPLDKNTT
jgi:CHAT domain-containing protein